jgi:hypothetical protein
MIHISVLRIYLDEEKGVDGGLSKIKQSLVEQIILYGK